MPDAGPFRSHDDTLEQGDIFSDVPLVKWVDGEMVAPKTGRAVITSDGCACEDYYRCLEAGYTQKAAKMMIHVAPLRQIQNQPEEKLETIKAGEHLDFFYMYGSQNVLPDHIVDLTYEQPVPASVLVRCNKIARLADWQYNGLIVHVAVARFHQKPEELFRADILEGRDAP